MGTSSKKAFGLDASGNSIGGNYLSEIQQEIGSLNDGDCKIILHPDGHGSTIVTRNGYSVTILTNRSIKTGILKKGYKVQNDLTELKGDGVYQNGRKL